VLWEGTEGELGEPGNVQGPVMHEHHSSTAVYGLAHVETHYISLILPDQERTSDISNEKG
jgi:hypothetical protein